MATTSQNSHQPRQLRRASSPAMIGARLAGVIATATASLLLSACGSSGTTQQPAGAGATSSVAAVGATSSATQTAGNALHTGSAPEAPAVRHAKHPDPIHSGAAADSARQPATPANTPDKTAESQVAATAAPNPCLLVTRAEAQSIVGKPVGTPQEAPLGPTCIYRPSGARQYITLTVESINFAKVKPHLRNAIQENVGGRTAYCAKYGELTTFVPLVSGKVLNVTGSCAVASQFVARALPRLSA